MLPRCCPSFAAGRAGTADLRAGLVRPGRFQRSPAGPRRPDGRAGGVPHVVVVRGGRRRELAVGVSVVLPLRVRDGCGWCNAVRRSRSPLSRIGLESDRDQVLGPTCDPAELAVEVPRHRLRGHLLRLPPPARLARAETGRNRTPRHGRVRLMGRRSLAAGVGDLRRDRPEVGTHEASGESYECARPQSPRAVDDEP